MGRTENETFKQDRQGNVRRDIDEVRGLDGMEEVDGDGDPNGIVEIVTGDDDGATDVILFHIPDDASGFHLEEVHAHNGSADPGTFTVYTATLNDDGTVNTTTRRSVPLDVDAGATRTISYSGREFEDDAIVVNSNFTGFIGTGGYTDKPEEIEPASEQTEAPGS